MLFRSPLTTSHVELNRHFQGLTAWDEQAIRQRGQMLALRVAQIWSRPAGVAYRLPVPAASLMTVTGTGTGEQVFTIRQVGIYAKMVERDGQFVVLAGSTARRTGTPTWTGLNRQQQLLVAGKLADAGDTCYQFAVDVPFDTISGASALVLARQSNGNVEWRIEIGRAHV